MKGDCFICEADLFVSDSTIFTSKLERSCYYGKFVGGHSDDWVFEQNEEGIITRVGKVGDDCFNMTGIAFFKKEDAAILYKVIETEYGVPGYEDMFWDDVINKHIDKFSLVINPVNCDQIIEIDTVAELEAVREGLNNKGIL